MTTATDRCPNCDHLDADHSDSGCWYTVTLGPVGSNLVCVCDVNPASNTRG